MKKIIILIVIIAVGVWGLQTYTDFKAVDYVKNVWQKISVFSGGRPLPDPEKQLNIFIRQNGFIPNLSAARAGIKVTWINEDNKPHTVTGENWGSGELLPGQAYSRVFEAAGDHKYFCSIHPSETGEIIIR